MYMDAETKHILQLGVMEEDKNSSMSAQKYTGFFLQTKVSMMIYFCVFSMPSEVSEPGKLQKKE